MTTNKPLMEDLGGTFKKVQENCKRVMLPSCNARLKGCLPSPQDPDCLRLHPPLRRLLEEGRAAMETVQVCEVPLPAPKRQEQHYLRKDRSWEKAEQQAQEIRESWDPLKQKLRELDELKQAQELGEVTITYALERWLASVTLIRNGRRGCKRRSQSFWSSGATMISHSISWRNLGL